MNGTYNMLMLSLVLGTVCLFLTICLVPQDGPASEILPECASNSLPNAMKKDAPSIQAGLQAIWLGKWENVSPDTEGEDKDRKPCDFSAFAEKGIIRGRIINEFGDPVVGAQIGISKKKGMLLRGELVSLPKGSGPDRELSAISDDQGIFKIENVVRTDCLFIQITHPDFGTATFKLKAFDGGKRDLGDLVLTSGDASGFLKHGWFEIPRRQSRRG